MNAPSLDADENCHNRLDAAYYADRALQCTAKVVANSQVAADTFKLRFLANEISRRFQPGQFLMLRIAGTDDPLIGRPLAMYDIVEEAGDRAIEVVYLVAGNLTSRLAVVAEGAKLEVWGPLGNGFVPRSVDHLVIVAGGIGHTPFLAVAKQHFGAVGYAGAEAKKFTDRITLCYGARSENMLAGVDDFRAAGVDVRVATDDGSVGHAGMVTDLLPELLQESNVRVMCCGPEPMMAAVAGVASKYSVTCEVSLETPMACGIGICFSCVAQVRDAQGNWDYKRTCVEGPCFRRNSNRLVIMRTGSSNRPDAVS